MSMIKIEHLRKRYPNATPLEDVCAEINKGDIISVIGPSGTGKTTLLRCMNRLEDPTSGRILFDGEDITDPKCKMNLIRRKMGMVFQSFNLFGNLNVIENVITAPIQLLKVSRQQAYEEGMALLERVGLADKAENYPDELSGGQKQRVAIARAIAMKPEILLFDEPTSALDPTMIGEVLSVIRALAKDGMTMMIVTHEMKFARDVSNRVFYMDEGGIYEEGTPEQIFEHPQKERTRRFIRQLKTLDLGIADPEPDYLALINKLEQFGKSAMLPAPVLRHTVLIFEELVIQLILKELSARARQEELSGLKKPDARQSAFPVRVNIEHSDIDGTNELRVVYGGDRYDPLSEGDPLSVIIVKKLAKEAHFCYETENEVTVHF